MKIFTTSILAFFLSLGVLSAQTVVVNSPADLEGVYAFDAAGFGAVLTDTTWTADAAFVDDGSGETASQGCGAAVNGADLDGKIALIDRGSCEFGLKCLNAENAGAIAAIVFNNQPGNGTIVMGAGVNGGSVTIPCVMLSYEDGQAIRQALENGPVNITIGNLKFNNDLAVGVQDVIHAPAGIVPMDQLGDFEFLPGARTTNIGLNDASNVMLNATIDYTDMDGNTSNVYDESMMVTATLAADSVSALTTLPSFVPANGMGTYTATYTVSTDSTETSAGDNALVTTFDVSQNMFSKASLDPNTGEPRTTIGYTISGGGDVEFLSVFNVKNAMDYTIDSIYFYVSTNEPSLAGIPVEAYIYEWNDLDGNGGLSNDEVGIAGLSTFTFPDDFEGTTTTLTLPVLDFITFEETGVVIPENDKNYILGVRYTGEFVVFFGFDESVDHTQYIDFRTANETLTDFDYSYLLVTGYNDFIPDFEGGLSLFSGVGAASSAAMLLTAPEVSTEDIVGADVFEMEVFPNPATEKLMTTLSFKERTAYVEYHITDANGRYIFSSRDNQVDDREQAEFDVKSLPAGQYYMTIRTEQGVQAKPFVKQ